MKIYLAGGMRGKPNSNQRYFNLWAGRLRTAGHEVFSPRENSAKLFGEQALEDADGDESKLGGDLMTISRTVFSLDLQWICLHADAVALMPGWEKSKGASAERAVAKALPIPVRPAGDFLR